MTGIGCDRVMGMATEIQPGQPGDLPSYARPTNENTYPWERWANGHTWQLTHGVDYTGTHRKLTEAAKKHAQRHGYHLRYATTATSVRLRFIPKEPNT
jgi:hypothetical protein